MLDIIDSQAMLLDMLAIAAWFFVPDNALPHGLLLPRLHSLWQTIAITQQIVISLEIAMASHAAIERSGVLQNLP